jgi:hypothetical protein
VEPVNVIVDDLFPCIPGGGPVFTHNKGDEIWVLLIEKAYAKMMSCYFQLKSGTPGDAFSDFTGCPVESFNFEDKKTKARIADQSFWKDLLTWDKRKCVMAAGKYGEDKFSESGLDPSNKAGLVPGHAYSLIEVKEGLGHRLVKLRNPWGRFEWKGDWGDHSKLWTKEAIAHFKPEFKDDDGIFWMDYRHFLVNFDNVEVCYATTPTGKNWHQKRWKGNFAVKAPFNATQFYEIELSRDTDMFFSIFQPDQRIPGAPDNVEVGILVADASGNLAACTEVRAKNRVCGPAHGVTLTSGKYTIIPFTAGARFRKSSHTTHSFVFGVHADDDDGIQLQPISANLELLTKTRMDHLRQNGTKQVWNGHSVYSFVDANLSSFGIEAGTDKKTDIEFTLDFTGSKNVFSAMGGLKVSKTLKPGHGAIFQDLAIDNPDNAMSLTYGIQAKFVKS